MIQNLVIFEASGDLTSRVLMPVLVRFHQADKLPDGFRVVGVAQDDWNTEKFRSHLEQKLAASGTADVSGLRETILAKVSYRRADVTSRDQLARALGDMTDPLVAYLALPPALFAPSIESLGALKLPKGSKVVLEKPFGDSTESAQALNRLLHESFPERDAFRLDHFLGKQTAQNILGLRFANRIFEPVWNTHILSGSSSCGTKRSRLPVEPPSMMPRECFATWSRITPAAVAGVGCHGAAACAGRADLAGP